MTFETRWETEADASLAADGPGNRRLTLRADESASTSLGRLSVSSEGMPVPSGIAVQVIGKDAAGPEAHGAERPGPRCRRSPVPPPRLRPISVTGLKEGESRTVDVASYLDSPLAKPACTITSARVEKGTGLTTSTSGCRLTLTVGTKPSPTASVAAHRVRRPGARPPAGRR